MNPVAPTRQLTRPRPPSRRLHPTVEHGPQEHRHEQGDSTERTKGATPTVPTPGAINLEMVLSAKGEAQAGQAGQGGPRTYDEGKKRPQFGAVGVCNRAGGTNSRRHGGPEAGKAAGSVPMESQVVPAAQGRGYGARREAEHQALPVGRP